MLVSVQKQALTRKCARALTRAAGKWRPYMAETPRTCSRVAKIPLLRHTAASRCLQVTNISQHFEVESLGEGCLWRA
jgi:hypothetical protein